MSLSALILILCFSKISIQNIDSRIIGGQLAKEEQYPFAVGIFHVMENGAHFCGGSILNEKWILTAAHCLLGATDFRLYFGVTSLNEAATNGVILSATEYVVHPSYINGSLDHDIGLILSSSPIPFNSRIQRIKLLNESIGPYETTIALGWGATADNMTLQSNELYHVSLITISNAVCRRTYGDYVKENMLCTTALEDDNGGICEGDSGGPLIQVISENVIVQVGVSCFYSGVGCETKHPSGFTRTFEYLDWIKNVTGIEDLDQLDPPVGGYGDVNFKMTFLTNCLISFIAFYLSFYHLL